MQALSDAGNVPDLIEVLKMCNRGKQIIGRDCFKIFDGIEFSGAPKLTFKEEAACSKESRVIGLNLKGTSNG